MKNCSTLEMPDVASISIPVIHEPRCAEDRIYLLRDRFTGKLQVREHGTGILLVGFRSASDAVAKAGIDVVVSSSLHHWASGNFPLQYMILDGVLCNVQTAASDAMGFLTDDDAEAFHTEQDSLLAALKASVDCARTARNLPPVETCPGCGNPFYDGKTLCGCCGHVPGDGFSPAIGGRRVA